MRGIEKDDSIFAVIYYFIVLLVLGLLYYFLPPLRFFLIALIAVTALTFIVNLLISFFRITARRHRVLNKWAERKLGAISDEEGKEPVKSEQDNEKVISYGELEIKTGVCGRCGGRLVLRRTKKGGFRGRNFYGCSNYPGCKKIIPAPEPQERAAPAKGAGPPVCGKCGSEMVLRTARRGRFEGQKFYGCSNYPECSNIINIK